MSSQIFDPTQPDKVLQATLASRLNNAAASSQQSQKGMIDNALAAAAAQDNINLSNTQGRNQRSNTGLSMGLIDALSAPQFQGAQTQNVVGKLDTTRNIEDFLKIGQGANQLSGAGIMLPQGERTQIPQLPTKTFVQGDPKAVTAAKAANSISGEQSGETSITNNTILGVPSPVAKVTTTKGAKAKGEIKNDPKNEKAIKALILSAVSQIEKIGGIPQPDTVRRTADGILIDYLTTDGIVKTARINDGKQATN